MRLSLFLIAVALAKVIHPDNINVLVGIGMLMLAMDIIELTWKIIRNVNG